MNRVRIVPRGFLLAAGWLVVCVANSDPVRTATHETIISSDDVPTMPAVVCVWMR
jgi:hypothetical protein